MAGKGSKPRPIDIKKWIENFPSKRREVEGFIRKRGKLVKKY